MFCLTDWRKPSKNMPSADREHTGERKDLCSWHPVRECDFLQKQRGEGCVCVCPMEAGAPKAPPPSLLLPPPEILACNYGLSGKGFPVCMLSPFTPTYP